MSRKPIFPRLMRRYREWRAGLFAFAALLSIGLFMLGQTSFRGGVSANEKLEIGTWLPQLFEIRPPPGLDRRLGVEIVGFDKSIRAEDYADLIKDNEPLRLIAEARGVRYDRAVFAAVLDRLVAAGARQVVFDFVFDGPGPTVEGDRAFASAILRHRDKVVIGFDYRFPERADESGNAEKQVARLEPLEDLLPDAKPEEVLGFVTVWPDFSGGISTLVAREDRLTLAREALSSKWPEFEDLSLVARAAAKAGATVPADNRHRLINFAGGARTFRMTPVHDLFTPDRWRGPLAGGGVFRDRFVIVGPYSELHYKDSFPTPVGRMLGVEIQANCLRNLLERGWLVRPLDSAGAVGMAGALIGAMFALNTLVRTRRMGLVIAMLCAVPLGYLAVSALVFVKGVFLPFTPAAYALAYGLLCFVFDFIHARHEKSRIAGIFGAYLSPAIVKRMVERGEEPELGGEQVSLTAFFSDVQSFSSFSEVLTPPRLVEIMNEYLGAMTVILEECEGTLDKYIGDAIVAMFGAPIRLEDHAHRACSCALLMQGRLAELRAKWASEGDKWPPRIHAMRMRIGLNTGAATVGNMGSEKRFNYTMMGDTVNLAARCESGAKSAGVYTLVTGETAEAARRSSGRPILFRRLDLWQVKGRATPVTLYEAVCFADEATASTRECVRLYEEGLALYFQKDFAAARPRFAAALPLEPLLPGRDIGVEHCPSEILAARCDEYLASPPPPDWNGVHVMKSK